MIVKAAILLISVSVALSAVPCPQGCKCSTSEAICSTIPDAPFDAKIFKLSFLNPEEPLRLSKDLFKNLKLTGLSDLVIINAIIAELDRDAFTDLDVLTNLNVESSTIPELPVGLFDKAMGLKTINFSNSKLTNFVDVQSESVEEINLTACGIEVLEENAFEKCPQLNYLNLENNAIEKFGNMKSFYVEQLNLSHNKLRFFNFTSSFVDSESPLYLDLSYNPIESIIGFDEDVQEMYLKSCQLKDLGFVSKMTSLTLLDLSQNGISELPEDLFAPLTELQSLDLSNNKINTIPAKIFKSNKDLSKIILDGNTITLPEFVVDRNFVSEYFSCDRCNLETINENTFKSMPSLKIISLKNNHLTKIPLKLFQNVPNLNKIDLTNNSITQIEQGTFDKCTNLMNVILSGNPLKEVSAELFKYNNLKKLDLSSCKIENLWPTKVKGDLLTLEVLNLSNNIIKVVTLDELRVTKKLKSLNLAGNPLICNDVFKDMVFYLKHNGVATLQYNTETAPIESWLKMCSNLGISLEESDEDEFNEADVDKTLYDEKELDDSDGDKYEDVANDQAYNKYPENYESDADFDEDTDFMEDVNNVINVESMYTRQRPERREIIVYLLPTLVFVLTALIVLIITVATLLFILHRKKNATRTTNRQLAFNVKIPQWGGKNITKKHSGSVYRPLSEEKIPV